MKKRLNKLVPPGTNLKSELGIYGIMLGVMVIISFGFLSSYQDAWNGLYMWEHNRMKLVPGAVITDFDVLIAGKLAGLVLLLLGCALMVALHYMSFYHGSKSIYIMKRIPNPWEIHKRCILLPILCFVVGVLIALGLVYVYFYIYIHNTPVECLPKDITLHIWRSIL